MNYLVGARQRCETAACPFFSPAAWMRLCRVAYRFGAVSFVMVTGPSSPAGNSLEFASKKWS